MIRQPNAAVANACAAAAMDACSRWNNQLPSNVEPLYLPLTLRYAIGDAVADALAPGRRFAQVPADWWIAENGNGIPCVWRPGDDDPEVVVRRGAVDDALWAVLAAVLPDRSDCPECTADPCTTHATGDDQ